MHNVKQNDWCSVVVVLGKKKETHTIKWWTESKGQLKMKKCNDFQNLTQLRKKNILLFWPTDGRLNEFWHSHEEKNFLFRLHTHT